MNLHSDSLWIGALIKDRIEGIVPVYPLIAPAYGPRDYCVYRRSGYSGRDTKDRFNYEETLFVELAVVSPSYMEGIRIAQAVKDRLDGASGTWEGKMIERITMTNASEEYGDQACVQRLFFSIVIDLNY